MDVLLDGEVGKGSEAEEEGFVESGIGLRLLTLAGSRWKEGIGVVLIKGGDEELGVVSHA